MRNTPLRHPRPRPSHQPTGSGTKSTNSSAAAKRQEGRVAGDLTAMYKNPQRTPARLLRFALRCGDDELVNLLLRALAPTPRAALAEYTYRQLAARIGIAPAH